MAYIGVDDISTKNCTWSANARLVGDKNNDSHKAKLVDLEDNKIRLTNGLIVITPDVATVDFYSLYDYNFKFNIS